MSRPDQAANTKRPAPTPQASVVSLPANYRPRVAGYARGPFVDPVTVTPTSWRWRNARSYIVRAANGHDYRCVRVSSNGTFVGYWAVELIGIPLPLTEWE